MQRAGTDNQGVAGRFVRRLAGARAGSTAVEFALLGLAVFGFFFALLNLGLLGLTLSVLQRATVTAARMAAVNATIAGTALGNGVCPTVANVTGYFNNNAQTVLPAAGSANGPVISFYSNASGQPVAITGPWVVATTGAPTGTYVAIGVTYTWRPIGFAGLVSVPMSIRTVSFAQGAPACTDG